MSRPEDDGGGGSHLYQRPQTRTRPREQRRSARLAGAALATVLVAFTFVTTAPTLTIASATGADHTEFRQATTPARVSTRLDPQTAVHQRRPIDWFLCPGDKVDRCSSVTVPINYAQPDRGTISLSVIEHIATAPGVPEGDLLVNPGGPGESGVEILPVMTALLPAAVTAHFNVISFDERGTGASDKITCGPGPATVVSVPPVVITSATTRHAATTATSDGKSQSDLPGTPVFTALANQCRRTYGSLLASINTTNAARDMDVIRQALGVQQISYYGLSYGTVLGAVYATMFPGRVKAMVLDGAVDPLLPLSLQAAEEAPAIQATLNHFFTTCSTETTCALHQNPSGIYHSLETRLEQSPLPSPAGRPPVTLGDLLTATLYFLSVPSVTGNFPAAVMAAADGNGEQLRALSVGFDADLDGSSLVAPLWTITCEDATTHPSPTVADALARRLDHQEPVIGAFAVLYVLAGCIDWPVARQPITHLHASSHLPVLVIGNTGDPNTPYLAARQLTAALGSARLLTYVGWGHTWLLNRASDPCISSAVSNYFVSGTLPAKDLRCN